MYFYQSLHKQFMKNIFLIIILLSAILSCNNSKKTMNTESKNPNTKPTKVLNSESLKIRNYLKKDIVIAHRGSTYWTPEETEPAYRWARNIGADYLELDLQMTKDSILVAYHDNTLLRTSNVSEVFPEIKNPTTNDFTLKQLRNLDYGSWFNKSYPKRARKSFIGLEILTFKDVLMIAEGYQIKKKDGKPVKEIINGNWTGKYLHEKDPNDNQNRPGVYTETKKLGLEKLLAKELKEYQWLITDNPKKIKTYKNKVAIANTNGRFILQSFYRESIEKLNIYLPNIPKCLLIWKPEMDKNLKNGYIETINYCINNNVEIMGPSIAGAPNNYGELTAPWMVELIHQSGMLIHPYTFDTVADFDKYANSVDGVFTNRADLGLIYYKRLENNISEDVLIELGY